MLTRVLPGGVIVAAALASPEFSVGAGDPGRGERLSMLPEPSGVTDRALARRKPAAPASATRPGLEGVRYAPVLDLGTQPAPAAVPRPAAVPGLAAPALPTAPAAPAALVPAQTPTAPALAAPVAAVAAAPEIVPPLADPPPAPLLAPPVEAPAPRLVSMPQIPAAMSAAPTAAPPLAPPEPSRPLAADQTALAAFVPEEQAALGAPAASRPAPVASAATLASTAPVVPAAAVTLARTVAPAQTLAPVAAAPIPAGRAAMPTGAPASAPAPVVAPVSKPAARLAPTPAPLAAPAVVVPKPAPVLAAPPSASAPRIADFEVKSQLLTRIDGRTAGALDFQQTPAGLKVRLGSLVEVLADRFDAATLARIRASAAGGSYLSLTELQAQGVPISYDPVYDEFNIGRDDTRPRNARKVTIEQIGTPERGAGATAIDQLRR